MADGLTHPNLAGSLFTKHFPGSLSLLLGSRLLKKVDSIRFCQSNVSMERSVFGPLHCAVSVTSTYTEIFHQLTLKRETSITSKLSRDKFQSNCYLSYPMKMICKKRQRKKSCKYFKRIKIISIQLKCYHK